MTNNISNLPKSPLFYFSTLALGGFGCGEKATKHNTAAKHTSHLAVSKSKDAEHPVASQRRKAANLGIAKPKEEDDPIVSQREKAANLGIAKPKEENDPIVSQMKKEDSSESEDNATELSKHANQQQKDATKKLLALNTLIGQKLQAVAQKAAIAKEESKKAEKAEKELTKEKEKLENKGTDKIPTETKVKLRMKYENNITDLKELKKSSREKIKELLEEAKEAQKEVEALASVAGDLPEGKTGKEIKVNIQTIEENVNKIKDALDDIA